MASTIEELTVNWREGDKLKVKELDKLVLSTGMWVTIAFLYQDLDPNDPSAYRAPKIALRRYKKRGDRYVVDTRFTLTTDKQALEFAAAIGTWFSSEGAGRTLEVQAGSVPRAAVGSGVDEPPPEE